MKITVKMKEEHKNKSTDRNRKLIVNKSSKIMIRMIIYMIIK